MCVHNTYYYSGQAFCDHLRNHGVTYCPLRNTDECPCPRSVINRVPGICTGCQIRMRDRFLKEKLQREATSSVENMPATEHEEALETMYPLTKTPPPPPPGPQPSMPMNPPARPGSREAVAMAELEAARARLKLARALAAVSAADEKRAQAEIELAEMLVRFRLIEVDQETY